ncbi:hypothetical protein D6779_11770 [Candidatus Parcubacteria bacterium]|nr:MAG: hypothetical protein D6779_11770 [Candidatus Parcubacteria bacterium]
MLLIYLSCTSVQEAEKIAGELIANRAAESVDIFPVSVVRRDAKRDIEKVEEAAMLVKTIEAKVHEVREIAERNNSRRVPCVASFAAYRINRKYKEHLTTMVG